MGRVPMPFVVAVLVVTACVLHPSISKAHCTPKCARPLCMCGDRLWAPTDPDSTHARRCSHEWEQGLGAGFSSPALTLGIETWADTDSAWMENSLEKPLSGASSPDAVTLLSVRVTRGGVESGYAVSMKAPDEHSTFRVSVLNKGRTVWTAGKKPAGNVAVVDEWPRFASVGAGNNRVATAGFAYSTTRAIHLPGASHAETDTTVMGDQIRVALEGKTAPKTGVLRLHWSAAVDSVMLQSARAGLFNLAKK